MTSHVLIGAAGVALGAMLMILWLMVAISTGSWIGHDGYRYKIVRDECTRQPCMPVNR
jgi:hypothetical protein